MAITDIIEETELTAGAPSIKYEGDMNPNQGSGIMEMASMESGQEGTLEEIYFELIADGMDPESASIKAREIYNNMSSNKKGIGSMAGGENNRVRELLLLEETQGLSEEEKEELRQLIKTISAQMPQGGMDEGIGGMMQEPRTMAMDGGIMRTGFKGGGSDASTTSFSQSYDSYSPGSNTASTANTSVDNTQSSGQTDADRTNDRISQSDLGQTQTENNQAAIDAGKKYAADKAKLELELLQKENAKKYDKFGYEKKPSLLSKFSILGTLTKPISKFLNQKQRDMYLNNYTDKYDTYQDYLDAITSRFDPSDNDGKGGDSGNSQQFIPTTPDDSEEEVEEEEPFQLGLAFRSEGGRVGKAYGGSMGDDGRRAYGLGSIFKKIKKVAKSPIGKAALIGLGGYGLSGGLSGTSFMQGLKSQGLSGILKKAGGYALKNPGTIIPLASAAGALFTEEDEDEDKYVDNTGIDVKKIRENPYDYLPRAMRAEGGPMGGEIMEGESEELLDMNGMEKDYREDGGFVPIGEYEKKDDVPARLSKNEFVFTADAVRGAGEGDVDLGAEKLYTQMKELESVGKRMQGANEMFQTSQRLEEVI